MPALRVAVLEPGYADYATERALLAPLGAEVVPVAEAEDAVATVRALDPVALLVRERAVSAAVLAAAPNLRLVVRYGVGVDNIDLAAATARRIPVANVPDYGAEHEVSDHAVALYLAVIRRIVRRDAQVRSGVWGVGQAETVPGHRRGTLGLIGFGRIARQTCRKFRALGFATVLAVDPNVDAAAFAAEGAMSAELDRLLAEADVVSLHTPLTAGTHHLLDAPRLARMKPSAVLINVSRGGLVDEAALVAALTAGRLFGAGLDVFEQEPPGRESAILTAPNTVVTDHMAWYSEDSVAVLQSNAAREVQRVLAGELPVNWVNRW